MTGAASPSGFRRELRSGSEAETRALACQLGARLRGGDVVALHGPLGAGKTCFVRGLAQGLGIDPREVTSPTFVLCQEYEPSGDRHDRPALAHLDGYRLSTPDELDSIGWEELVEAMDSVIAVEWAERFEDRLPAEHLRVELAHLDARARAIVVSAPDAMVDRLGLRELDASERRCRCSICGTETSTTSPSFPFCSPRCRLVDLGRWFGERYRID